ncbi:F5-F8-type-C multi-domain protein [Pyrenophora tritici-repentis]|uniref:F5-F8-type-C multi-domain protein n=1 Tax=Pyrenophora tritici-repentis TaxID=45151 RepID=A0A2W1GE29_9PLEO|nr:F5-F8-type-C multi-domain protein [Pyrenophora tritici-repentis]KAF7450247.1 F5-F8-type-C multi-domain protein [Pyrenophora tritici-repentis]KAF7572817.1 F5-F8-type-C multi-domain protein [Pyrenophora tritici-repentis]KAG9376213.1 F5-F8-type-C multi-domain protein [Pyrenophora tritici-repentis]KAI0588144.1 F5-F8-type-C multi-domain protein [Pyrenophora tritici-repentis]
MKVYNTLALVPFIGQINALLDADTLVKNYFGNDAPWYRNRIPFFESSDQDLTNVYYYRWGIFRAHQRDLGANGFISTEFLDDVGWQHKPWASLNDATGFHLLEGRWVRDRRFKDDYQTFMFSANSNRRQFSESMAASVWQTYLVDGAAGDATKLLDAMQVVYEAWKDSYDTSKGLYSVEPLRDATEYTISSIDASGAQDGFTGGNSFRPSINSYQYANARAIANIAALKGGLSGTVSTYNSKATALKGRVQDALWNSTYEHFIDRFQVNNKYVTYWDFIRGRELVGMVPWTHDLPDDTAAYAKAWTHVLNTNQLAGPHGLRTVEPSYQWYMRQYRYEGKNPECQWNGPIWPFQTTQVLTGLANFLDHYRTGAATGIIKNSDYVHLLKQYAQLHRNPKTGVLDLEEDYYPDTGLPIVGLKRSNHYFHSGFNDLIITGLVGIRPSTNASIEVNPLADSSISYFRLDRVLYHGREVAIQWDATGSHYGTAGLQIEVDGKVVASSPKLGRLSAPLTSSAPTAITRKIVKSVQLNSTTAFPHGTTSTNEGTSVTYPAIDGRIYFYSEPNAKNGWDSPAGNGADVWYQIDFGSAQSISSAELAFYANAGQGYDVPASYSIQVLSGSTWTAVQGGKYDTALANGITNVAWNTVSSRQVRVLFRPKSGSKVRVVEFKVY